VSLKKAEFVKFGVKKANLANVFTLSKSLV